MLHKQDHVSRPFPNKKMPTAVFQKRASSPSTSAKAPSDSMDDTQLQLLLDTVVVPLAGLLSVDSGHDSSNGFVRELPQLTVSFWLIRGGAGSPRKIDAKVRPALQALAQLMVHSQHVSGSPVKKARLWRRVLQDSRLFGGSTAAAATRKLEDWVLQSEAFPRVVLDFSRTKVSFELVDAICGFFQDFGAIAMDGRAGTDDAKTTSKFGLKFAQCQLRSQELRLTQQLLDRVCNEEHRGEQPWPRFRVYSLDLSDNGMNAAELLEVALILKSNDVYRLEEVVLENVVGRKLASEGLNSLCALVGAAFDVDTIVKSTSAMRHRLVHLSLQGNSLSARAYASICSAFRHSHTVNDLSLAGTLSVYDASEREQCWRWLALGLFYPCPSGSRELLKIRRIDLSGNPLYPNDIEALRRALTNPSAELLPRGETEINRLALDEAEDNKVGVCSVQKGTRIYASPDIGSDCIFQLDHQTELEDLCTRAEWVCVLIPGFGFGWAQAERVERVDLQAVERDQATQTRYELILNNLSASESTSQALSSLFEILGRRLCALELRHFRVDQLLLESILRHCTRLERLDFEGCSLIGSGMTSLLDALRGDLGSTLLSLNLNGNYIGFEFTEQLAIVLASPDRTPVLRELRLSRSSIGDRGLVSLYYALQQNKTLSMLELHAPSDPAFPVLTSDDAGFSAKYQDELLRIDPLPLNRKLAFLSVFVNPLAAVSVRSELDTWMLTLILQFAAQDVRRRISWR